MTLVLHLYKFREKGLPLGTLAGLTGESDDKERTLLKFLRKLEVCETYVTKNLDGTTTRPKWRLRADFQLLCDKILL